MCKLIKKGILTGTMSFQSRYTIMTCNFGKKHFQATSLFAQNPPLWAGLGMFGRILPHEGHLAALGLADHLGIHAVLLVGYQVVQLGSFRAAPCFILTTNQLLSYYVLQHVGSRTDVPMLDGSPAAGASPRPSRVTAAPIFQPCF